jgi:SAM-dependent methyltransferase
MIEGRLSMFWTHLIPGTRRGEDADSLRNNLNVHELPRGLMFMTSALNILARDLGFLQSAEQEVAAWGDGEAIPLMSYSLIEYVSGLALQTFDCLELGGGRSTQFWTKRMRRVLTLDTDAALVALLSKGKPANLEVIHVEAAKFAEEMGRFGPFDAVIIDASANRVACARSALRILKPGGYVILDNSDWYPNAARVLRDADLIQVDFHDFRPCHAYRCTTSMFLHREFRPKPRTERLPVQPIGGKTPLEPNGWDLP